MCASCAGRELTTEELAQIELMQAVEVMTPELTSELVETLRPPLRTKDDQFLVGG